MRDSELAEFEDSAPADESDDDCDCAGLPDGVPCFACYLAGEAFDEADR